MRKLFDYLSRRPFLGRGFRPFFFAGAVYAVLSILMWGAFYGGHFLPPDIIHDPVGWHAHEMIYGFTMAIVAGFLLTAVANWTGGAPARQLHLAGLLALWLAGRFVMNIETGLPEIAVYTIAAAFIPALAVSLAVPLFKSRNLRNFVFLGLLTVLLICEIAFFAGGNILPLYIAVLVILAMISLIGGRIIPAFTVAALRRRGEEAFQTPQPKTDIAALLSIIAVALALVFYGGTDPVFGVVSFVAAALHLLRMRHYHSFRTFNDPMLWILHLGYLWLVIGFFCAGLAGFGLIGFSTALHVLTVGSIGSMTLGMMCRVTLGHTGRDLIASPVTVLAFILIQAAALVRVGGVLLMPEWTDIWVMASSLFWAAAFALYMPVYVPMLWQPRPDGRPA